MTFVQIEFLAFILIVFTLYYGFRNLRWQNVMLLVASAIFYGWVHPWFLILLFAASTMDYFVALAMDRCTRGRGWILALSVVGNLGMLGFYKYYDFFVVNVAAVMQALGMNPSLRTLGLFLPVGISFYTFQTMSYTIDVYRREIPARKDFINYQLFVTFFPQLVAGPIERAGNLLSQIERPRTIDKDRLISGLSLALWGAFKKVCIADTISPYVDKAFSLNDPSGPLIWAAVLGFTIQILTDFSGYTDIARGVSRMLGFELMKNFDHPYISRNPSEFWRRWHISFSSWIRDYIYIPLGGSKGGHLGTLKATFGAMLLSGFWHGASWNYVLWGGYHAALLTGYRYIGRPLSRATPNLPGKKQLQIAIFFVFTVFGWMLFRERDMAHLSYLLRLNPFVASADQWVATVSLLAICGLCALPLVVALAVEKWVIPSLSRTDWALPCTTSLWAFEVVGLFIFTRMTAMDFIYFQF